ncbi:MAG: hypothetical protein AB1750_06990, partial [Chloroflexota bacterium]
DPVFWDVTPQTSVVTDVVSVAQGMIKISLFFVLIFHSVQQVRLIARIHREAANVNLYQSDTHHAFSRLTVRAAIGLVLPLYAYLFIAVLFNNFGTSRMSAVDIGIVAFAVLIAVGVFVLPLLGMRRRLVNEKERLLIEANRQFDATTRKLHQRLEADHMEKMDDFNKALASLVIEKDTLKKISTWPWEAETMRGFLSSVGLPILLWFVTTYLGRFFQ